MWKKLFQSTVMKSLNECLDYPDRHSVLFPIFCKIVQNFLYQGMEEEKLFLRKNNFIFYCGILEGRIV